MSEVLSENELRDRIMLLGHELIDAEHFLKYANEIIESHKALQRRVEWTTEKPTKEGWYHYKNSWMKDRWTIYEVVSTSDGGLYVMRLNEHVDNLPDNIEWSFIPPPHEARG